MADLLSPLQKSTLDRASLKQLNLSQQKSRPLNIRLAGGPTRL